MARSRSKLFSRCADRTGGSAGRSSRFVFATIVHDSSLSSLDAAQPPLTQSARQTGRTSGSGQATEPGGGAASSDDISLGELVKTLRSMAADSPETQSRLEQIAQNYAQGTYRVDAQATAAKIIDDAFE
jgi:anti-sigma28 factor (negative regulator of flagellin synthesis)